MSLVNLVIGGVQKGGTTTLYHQLERHPAITFGFRKELHVADSPEFSDPHLDLEPLFLEAFAGIDGAETFRYRADATPIYCYWPNSIEHLARYNSALKLILIFRDPIERAFSHWQMEYARDWDKMTFPEAIRSGRGRVFTDPAAPGYHRIHSYVERGFYSHQLRRVFAHFPREQVLVLENQMLRDDLAGTLDRIWRFLDLEAPAAPPEVIRANTAPRFDYGYEFDHRDGAYLYHLYRWDIEAFAELSGLDVSHWGARYRDGRGFATAEVLRGPAVAPTPLPPAAALSDDAAKIGGRFVQEDGKTAGQGGLLKRLFGRD